VNSEGKVKNKINWMTGCPLGSKGQVSGLMTMFMHIDWIIDI
jgi:hypothetical protein